MIGCTAHVWSYDIPTYFVALTKVKEGVQEHKLLQKFVLLDFEKMYC